MPFLEKGVGFRESIFKCSGVDVLEICRVCGEKPLKKHTICMDKNHKSGG